MGVAYQAGTLLFLSAVVAFLTFPSGASVIALLTISATISGLVGVLALVDTIRIAIGNLKPKSGFCYLAFLQTCDKP